MKEELDFNKLKIPILETMIEEEDEKKEMMEEKEATPLKEKKGEKKE